MNINYKITEYFKKNNLFTNEISNGLNISIDNDSITIKGSQRDLVELADLLANVAIDKTKGAHLHIDELTLLDKDSNIKELIIEKKP